MRKKQARHVRVRNGKRFFAGSRYNTYKGKDSPGLREDAEQRLRKKTKTFSINDRDEDGNYSMELPWHEEGFFSDLVDEHMKHCEAEMSDDGKTVFLYNQFKKPFKDIKKRITSYMRLKKADREGNTAYVNRIVGEKTIYEPRIEKMENGKNTIVQRPIATVSKIDLKKIKDAGRKKDLIADRSEIAGQKQEDTFNKKLKSGKLKPSNPKIKYKRIRKGTFKPHINK